MRARQTTKKLCLDFRQSIFLIKNQKFFGSLPTGLVLLFDLDIASPINKIQNKKDKKKMKRKTEPQDVILYAHACNMCGVLSVYNLHYVLI